MPGRAAREQRSVHYLKEAEAWQLLAPIAKLTQRSFTSWKEMSSNFLDGREAWAGERDPQFDAISNLLLDDKATTSPWIQLPWTTDLSE